MTPGTSAEYPGYKKFTAPHRGKIYLSTIGNKRLKRIHRTATNAEQYAERAQSRLHRWRALAIAGEQIT